MRIKQFENEVSVLAISLGHDHCHRCLVFDIVQYQDSSGTIAQPQQGPLVSGKQGDSGSTHV